jgi:hypothetical protein
MRARADRRRGADGRRPTRRSPSKYAYLFTARGLPLGASWDKIATTFYGMWMGSVGSPNAHH